MDVHYEKKKPPPPMMVRYGFYLDSFYLLEVFENFPVSGLYPLIE